VAKVKKTASKKPVSKTKKAVAKKPAAKKAIAKKSPLKATLAKKIAVKKTVAKVKPVKKSVAAKPAKKKPVKQAVALAPRRPSGVPEQLRDAALKILDERQAEEIVSFDLVGRSSVADYLIVASGRASRQLAAIAHYLEEAFTKLGGQRTRIEGLPEANWVLIDGGDVIVHLFMPEVRGFYNLEGIWGKRA
jgi:ribosome-associated protein